MRFCFVLLSIVLALTLEKADGQLVIRDRHGAIADHEIHPAIGFAKGVNVKWDKDALKQFQHAPVSAPAGPHVQWIVLTKDNCVPCRQSEADFQPWFEASGWQVGNGAWDHIRIINTDHEQNPLPQYATSGRPTFVLMVDGQQKIARTGYPGRQFMADEYKAIPPAFASSGFGAISVATAPIADQVGMFLDTFRPVLADRGSLTWVYQREGNAKPFEVAGVEIVIPQKTSAVWANTKDGLKITFSQPVKADLRKFFPLSVSLSGITIERDAITPSIPGLPDPRIRITKK